MLSFKFEQLNLENEFKKLGLGINISFQSGFKILGYFLSHILSRLNKSFWYLLASPRLWFHIDPGRKVSIEPKRVSEEIRMSLSPPFDHFK